MEGPASVLLASWLAVLDLASSNLPLHPTRRARALSRVSAGVRPRIRQGVALQRSRKP